MIISDAPEQVTKMCEANILSKLLYVRTTSRCARVLTDVVHYAVMWNAIELYHSVRDFTMNIVPFPAR